MPGGGLISTAVVSPLLLPALCQANRATLRHATLLCDALLVRGQGGGVADNRNIGKQGPSSSEQPHTSLKYQTPSSLPGTGGATIGQHLRHALDHVERAVDAASSAAFPTATAAKDASPLIRYDARTRGGPEETNVKAALERIRKIDTALQRLETAASSSSSSSSSPTTSSSTSLPTSWGNLPVQASFCLSGESDQEHVLPSTVARELGFAAHHAIHHLAMIKILVLGEQWLSPNDLPPDFGRAPSTLRHDEVVATTTTPQAKGATNMIGGESNNELPSQ